ncbi:hypothetical protein [Actinacidiphila oryziradicis]|uniref:Uncharacterized protein n=1 Tax=Actinacidiphila oryziradicis TaxID=2571141 RepID=A0A4U0RZ74_9ACTN|nr:hypothetical protein [Actinacidiphila oryziradicis]TJZ93684.1 hypothetical protein FCI23_54160 [Actinacidiphila oryziradicis]
MAETTDLLVPALRDVRDAQASVVDSFQAHIAVTPAGKYRRILERHIADAQDHVSSIDEHVEQLRPHDPLRDALDGVRDFAGQATRAARLPFDVAMAVPVGALWGRRRAPERQLLKNAEDEYAITAMAVATCRAGESIARETDDAAGAELLGSIRRHDEELLQTLGGSLAEHAGAVVAAANGGRSAERVGSTGAAQAVRAGWSRLQETVAGAIRWLPGVTRMWRELKGAAVAEDELPISGYGELTAVEVTGRLRHLSQADLATVEGYERAHAGRSTILNKIVDLRGDEPWPGYDSMNADEIRTLMHVADADLAQQVLDYERRHQERTTITTAAERITI